MLKIIQIPCLLLIQTLEWIIISEKIIYVKKKYLNSWVGVNLNAPTGTIAQSNSIAYTIYDNLSTSKKFFGGGLTSTSESSSFFYYC